MSTSIRSSGERLLSFFASILDLAELEGGRRVLEENEVRVDELLAASIAALLRAQAQPQGPRASPSARPAARLLKGDRFSLERMLGNLVENAIRFTPAGGRVTLAAYAATDGVVLEITDTGIGMSAEQLAALSQPFAFGDAALTRDRDGAGLGLAIARTIAELSGGRLAIDSRPGLGTTVAVSLPLRECDASTTGGCVEFEPGLARRKARTDECQPAPSTAMEASDEGDDQCLTPSQICARAYQPPPPR